MILSTLDASTEDVEVPLPISGMTVKEVEPWFSWVDVDVTSCVVLPV